MKLINTEDTKTTITFNEKITRVYDFVLKALDDTFEYKILYYRKPFKLEEVNFKTPVDELYNNESIDSIDC